MIYKQTGNLRAVQILLGHTKIGRAQSDPLASTLKMLWGVDIEDALELAQLKYELCVAAPANLGRRAARGGAKSPADLDAPKKRRAKRSPFSKA
jgi:hypothetical protein